MRTARIRPRGSFATGSLHFTGSADGAGIAGTFRNDGLQVRDGRAGSCHDRDARWNGLDIQLPLTSLELVEAGTLAARSQCALPRDLRQRRRALFIDTNGTFSTGSHASTNAPGGAHLRHGQLVTAHLRNEGDLFPGGLGTQSLRPVRRLHADGRRQADRKRWMRGRHDRLAMSGDGAPAGAIGLVAAEGSYAQARASTASYGTS